jgi:hypothetical protein|tara:strand:+ start:890 stop:1282 length:393 start_codon:yes stop_codon:yes gene_type:complete
MALTYTYKVRNLKVRDEVNSEGATLTNAVVQTYWDITGTNEDGVSASWSGATPFSAANVPAGSFTSFNDLTEEDVTAWIANAINTDPMYKAHIDEQLNAIIDATANVETEVSGEALPWGEPTPAPSDNPE